MGVSLYFYKTMVHGGKCPLNLPLLTKFCIHVKIPNIINLYYFKTTIPKELNNLLYSVLKHVVIFI